MTRTIAALSSLLASDNEVFRCLAAQALGRLQAVQSVDALLARLFDEDEDVCHDVADALGRLGDARAVTPLAELYAMAPFGDLKVAAVRALGRIGGNDAQTLLRRVAAQRDESWDAVEPEDWDSYCDAQEIAIEALGNLGDEAALPVIVTALDGEEGQELAPAALKALLGLGVPGREALRERLRNGSPAQRRQTARLLSREADADSSEVLRAALDDEDGSVRAEALAGLAGLEARLPPDTISRLVRDSDSAVRAESAVFLATLPVRNSAAHWKLLLRDEQPDVRAHAVKALGRVGLPASGDSSRNGSESAQSPGTIVEEWLRAALDDSRQEVGVAAVAAVAALAEQGIPRALEQLAAVARDTGRATAQRVAAVNALGQVRLSAGADPAGEGLSGLLGDSEATVRLAVLRALVEQGNGTAGSMLTDLVRGREADQARPAGTPASGNGNTAAAPAQEQIHLEGDANIDGEEEADISREEEDTDTDRDGDATPLPPPLSTLESIARSGENRPMPRTLENELAAAEFPEEEAHFLALARENLKDAQELLHPKKLALDLHVRVEAAKMLRGHPSEDASEALVAALGSGESALQEAAAETAGEMRTKAAVPALTALLSAESRRVRLAAVRALGEIGGREAEDALLAHPSDSDILVRREQVTALQGARDDRAGNFLRDALGDEEPEVARAAVMTLAARGDETALPGMLATLARHAGRNWRGLGKNLALHLREAGRNALLDVLEDPEQSLLVPVAIGVLEELEGARREEQA